MKLGVFGVLAATKLLQASSLLMQPRPHYSITSGMGSHSQNSESICQCDGVSSREGGIPGIGRLTAHNSDLEKRGLSETGFSRLVPIACESATSTRGNCGWIEGAEDLMSPVEDALILRPSYPSSGSRPQSNQTTNIWKHLTRE